ncbi:MAG TPA: kelch repeat-containing protein [Arachidicoccus sp.]
MKKLNFIVLFASVALFLASCNSSDSSDTTTEGNWVKRSSLNGASRAFGVAFALGNYAYVGTGKNANTPDTMLSDFYKYDPSNDIWTQVANIPAARYMGVAFTINGKGYVGTGLIDKPHVTTLSDFWEYNPDADSWTKKADFPNGGRYRATAFAVGDTGYVLCGYASDQSTYLKDMFDYNPSTDTWTSDAFSGNKRIGGTAFVYNNQGYVLGGTGSDGALCQDFYRFTPGSTDRWHQLRSIYALTDSSFDDDYSDIVRTDGVALVMGSDIYFAAGVGPVSSANTAASPVNNTWHYDPATDLWDRRSAIERGNRDGAVGFTVQGRGYIATGGMNASTYYDNLDEFIPSQDLNLND